MIYCQSHNDYYFKYIFKKIICEENIYNMENFGELKIIIS